MPEISVGVNIIILWFSRGCLLYPYLSLSVLLLASGQLVLAQPTYCLTMKIYTLNAAIAVISAL